MVVILTFSALLVGIALTTLYFRNSTARFRREQHIRSFVFPTAVLNAFRQHNPDINEKSLFLVARALRTFYLAHLRAGEQVIGMPSKAADALWHEFILDTKAYKTFCDEAFGKFFHHIPATSMQKNVYADEALQRTWRLACLEENINPRAATRLPLLFALDTKILFPEGNTFSLAGKREKDSGSSSAGFTCNGGGGSCADGDGGGCGGGCSG